MLLENYFNIEDELRIIQESIDYDPTSLENLFEDTLSDYSSDDHKVKRFLFLQTALLKEVSFMRNVISFLESKGKEGILNKIKSKISNFTITSKSKSDTISTYKVSSYSNSVVTSVLKDFKNMNDADKLYNKLKSNISKLESANNTFISLIKKHTNLNGYGLWKTLEMQANRNKGRLIKLKAEFKNEK